MVMGFLGIGKIILVIVIVECIGVRYFNIDMFCEDMGLCGWYD